MPFVRCSNGGGTPSPECTLMKLCGLDAGEVLLPEAFDLGPQPGKLHQQGSQLYSFFVCHRDSSFQAPPIMPTSSQAHRDSTRKRHI